MAPKQQEFTLNIDSILNGPDWEDIFENDDDGDIKLNVANFIEETFNTINKNELLSIAGLPNIKNVIFQSLLGAFYNYAIDYGLADFEANDNDVTPFINFTFDTLDSLIPAIAFLIDKDK